MQGCKRLYVSRISILGKIVLPCCSYSASLLFFILIPSLLLVILLRSATSCWQQCVTILSNTTIRRKKQNLMLNGSLVSAQYAILIAWLHTTHCIITINYGLGSILIPHYVKCGHVQLAQCYYTTWFKKLVHTGQYCWYVSI